MVSDFCQANGNNFNWDIHTSRRFSQEEINESYLLVSPFDSCSVFSSSPGDGGMANINIQLKRCRSYWVLLVPRSYSWVFLPTLLGEFGPL